MEILGNILFYIMMVAGLAIIIQKAPVISGLWALLMVIGHIRRKAILTKFREANR